MNLVVDMNLRKGSLGFDEFVRPIVSVARDCEVRHYTEIGPAEAEGHSHVILCGTPLKDNDYMSHLDKFAWVRECDRPILGICAGMQAIAAAYGSKVERCQEIGMTEIETVKENPLTSGRFKAYELHNHSVKPSREFDILAESSNCVQAIKHKTKPLFGVLFHPEVRNSGIINSFLEL